jgi:plastocyanin
MWRPKTKILLLGAVAWMALGGPVPRLGTSAYAAEATQAVIKIDNFTFTPGTLTVPVGTAVTWVNEDDIPHAIAEKNRAFKSKTLDTDDKFTYTFSTPAASTISARFTRTWLDGSWCSRALLRHEQGRSS